MAVHQPAAGTHDEDHPTSETLERDMSRFLVDLSIALHRFAMYPPGHPSLALGLDNLAQRAEALLETRLKIAIGVAHDRLVIEGVVTDAGHALLRALAERLHRHHLSALSILRGVTVQELSEAVAALAADPERGGPLGRTLQGEADRWPHVSLHPLMVGCLEMVNPDGADAAAPDRCAVLWVGLAQAALGRPPAEAPSTSPEPVAVAHAIDEHAQTDAYDQVIVGYLQQIAEEVRAGETADTRELRRRVSTLVSTMNPQTLRRLLDMGGDAVRRHAFVRTAAGGLGAAAVVDLVKAAAEASDEALSNGLVRLLTKLAGHADEGTALVQPLANSALRLQVSRLISGWNLADPNPEDYGKVLEHIARNRSGAVGSPSPVVGNDEHLRLLQMCLELETEGPTLFRAIDGLAEGGGLERSLPLVRQSAAAGGVGAAAWGAIASAETVRRLLARVPADFRTIDALLPDLPREALAPLFDLLLDSDDRSVRRAVFDRLRGTGGRGAPEAVARLGDARWYVVRNLLALLAEIEELPPGFDPLPWLGHEDPRVRREAFRVALRLEGALDRALPVALADADDRVLRVAVKVARGRPCAAAAPRLLELARRELADDELHAGVLEALVKAERGRDTRDVLLEIASRDSRRLRWSAHETRGRVAIKALAALAAYWPRDPLVVPLLRRAASSHDPETRLAVKGANP